MLSAILLGLFILACIILIITVLLQPGKADAGALFTSTVNSAAFGPRGTQSILSKITIGAAVAFMLTALLLSLPGLTGPKSVMQGDVPVAEVTPTPTPAPAASPVASPVASPTESPASSPAASPNQSESPATSQSPEKKGNKPK